MKSYKKLKPRGMKHKIRKKKSRAQRIGFAVTITFLIVIISVSGFFIHSMLSSPPQKQEISSTLEPKAAIVDQGSIDPTAGYNQTFIQTATTTLKQAGFTVDYYPGEKVTVEFYRNLPTHGYGLIILRVHLSIDRKTEKTFLFSSESYDNRKYVYEQLYDRILGGCITEEEYERGVAYFVISPLFVKYSMRGLFENTTIIMTGCYGLTFNDMAKAFIQKGAKVYISWNDSVSASHTDKTTTHLLQHLLSGKQTIDQAIEKTMKQVGPDPAYRSILTYYPLEAGDYAIQNVKSNIATNIIEIVITRDVLKAGKSTEFIKE